jgi:hypothetical protein
MGLMAKWKEIPLPEAIVKAALERAAAEAKSYDRSDAAIAIRALASKEEWAERALRAEAKLARAEDFVLRTLRYAGNNGDDFLADKARTTLAELKWEDRG